MISTSSIPSHSEKIVVRRINDECLLIPLTADIADMDSLYRLNDTGAFIWDSIDGKRNIKEITKMMAEEFDVDPGEAEKDLLFFIAGVQEFLEFSER
ncbi:MAG TPA: PqqD family protein [Bacteroidales bacterium]|nr:PqqD family protein [Bacteroidales bacterium]